VCGPIAIPRPCGNNGPQCVDTHAPLSSADPLVYKVQLVGLVARKAGATND